MTGPRVLVCGEALVDLVPVNDLLAPRLGGGPFNVAVTLGRLGSDTAFLSRLSTDNFGRGLMERLTESGVDTSMVQRGAEPTTLALTTLGPDGGAAYTFYAEGTADRLVADPGALPESVAALSFGTLSLLYEPGASIYETLLQGAHDAGKVTMLDPNIRPPAIDDPDSYRARFDSWLPSIDIVKVSEHDIAWLEPDGADVRGWLSKGPAAVLVTKGGSGLSILTERFQVDVAAPSTQVADTIGAGDTVHGAVLHRLNRDGCLDADAVRGCGREQWKRTLEYAAAAAAVTVSRPGADPPWARELTGD